MDDRRGADSHSSLSVINTYLEHGCWCRDAHYSPELLLYAWHNRSKVEALERQLADFVADSVKKRTSLAPMPKQQRHIAHLLAEQYGLASQSFGAEPNRYLQLFKVTPPLPQCSFNRSDTMQSCHRLQGCRTETWVMAWWRRACLDKCMAGTNAPCQSCI